jgi:hypothetical protein
LPDLNQDGCPDIVIASEATASIEIMFNAGSGCTMPTYL